MNLEVGTAHGHHDIGDGMAAREKILNLLAGMDVVVRHAVFLHECGIFRPFLLESRLAEIAFSDCLHDLERIGVVDSVLFMQADHDIVTTGDDLAQSQAVLEDEVLGISE